MKKQYKDIRLKTRAPQNLADGEVWLDVVGYEKLYQVSSVGRVRRISSIQFKNGIILSSATTRMGYKMVVLTKDGIRKSIKVHRLVARVFLEPDPTRSCVNHKNGIKYDNRAENLEWCTVHENNLHSYKHLSRIAISPEKTSKNKLTWRDVKCIRQFFADGTSKSGLAKRFGITHDHIQRIILYKCWKENSNISA